jgi:hypothetical protein
MANESDQQPTCGNPNCNSSTSGTSTLQLCGRCKDAVYCSRECQAASWPSHRAHCKRQNYIIKFRLCPGVITDPPVIRTLSCPATATLVQLHQALQIAFQWAGIHCYDFTVDNPQQYIPIPSRGSIFDSLPGEMRWFYDWRCASEQVPRRHLLRVVSAIPAYSIHDVDAALEGLRVQPTTEVKRAKGLKLFQFLEHERCRQGKRHTHSSLLPFL